LENQPQKLITRMLEFAFSFGLAAFSKARLLHK